MNHTHSQGAPAATPMDEARFRAMFDAMFDQVAIGESIRDASGSIVDFRMVYLNAASIDGAGRSAHDLVGRSVLECFPKWEESGLLDCFRQVVETEVPFVADRIPYEDVSPEGTVIAGHWSLSVVKFGDGYITASRDVTDVVAEEVAKHEAQLEAERSRMAVELLQRASLPDRLPELTGVELAVRYEPASGAQPVGGDWYDVFEVDDGQLGLVIADVSGHGLEAAAYMVQVRNIVRALAIEHTHPALALSRANQVVARLSEQNLFATCCYAVLDPATGTLRWASAGHLEPLLISEAPRYLATEVSPPLGVQPEASFPESTSFLEVGELLVMFTDGLVEDRIHPIKSSLDRLAVRAVDFAEQPTSDVADHLVASATDRSDDLALICVRRIRSEG